MTIGLVESVKEDGCPLFHVAGEWTRTTDLLITNQTFRRRRGISTPNLSIPVEFSTTEASGARFARDSR